MKETIIKCNECGAEISGPNHLLFFNGEEIDLCSDQCRLKWWITIATDAEAGGLELHLTSKAPEKPSAEPDNIPERNFKMLPGK
jgi:hypothetical protein